MKTSVHLLVGTRKGAWLYSSDTRRDCWEISEPILPGWSFAHLAADTRHGPPLLYGAANHWAWGRSVAKSADMGRTWDYRSEGLSFPEDMGISVEAVWCVQPGHPSEPGVVWAGTQPAGLFRSEDWGRTWQPVDSLNRHPWRPHWFGTGSNASSLHSIVIDPRDARHMYVSISSGGAYESFDGGKTWTIFSGGVAAQTAMAKAFIDEVSKSFPMPELPENVDPAATDEMHKLKIDEKNPDRLWTQTHVGVFRSDDRGASWHDVTEGLPSFFGFPIAVTKRGADAAYVVPLEFEQDNFRVCKGQFAVYRTQDSGASWQALTCGLPGPHDYQSVLREGLDTDGLDEEGVYTGTSNGKVYGSADGGDHWRRLPGTLPPILSVTAFAV